MSIRFIGANWKMNLTLQEAKLLYSELEDAINNELSCDVIIVTGKQIGRAHV